MICRDRVVPVIVGAQERLDFVSCQCRVTRCGPFCSGAAADCMPCSIFGMATFTALRTGTHRCHHFSYLPACHLAYSYRTVHLYDTGHHHHLFSLALYWDLWLHFFKFNSADIVCSVLTVLPVGTWRPASQMAVSTAAHTNDVDYTLSREGFEL